MSICATAPGDKNALPKFMKVIKILFVSIALINFLGCEAKKPFVSTPETPRAIADKFAYPVGKTDLVTQDQDKDDWYNAQDFGENNQLGEDWNKMTGGNSDCGEPVYAVANGLIVYAEDAGPGWGNVAIIEHRLPNGETVQSFYGHLQTISKTNGEVKKREKIGEVGNAYGRYPCHLHFEIRRQNCPMWNQAGIGYSTENSGWLDPSDFI